MKPKLRKQFITVFKIVISLLLITWVFRQLDWTQIQLMLKNVNVPYFVLGFLFFLASQLISIFRFNIFVRKVGVRINFKDNIRLYLLGMFYNFFLPGGVGGDAYKVYALCKAQNKSLKKVGQVVFIERFLGLLAIGFCLCILILFLKTPFPYFWNLLVGICGIIGAGIIIRLVIKFMFTYKKRVYIVFFYSILVQVAQLLSVLWILKSFQIEGNILVYLCMFLISSVLSIISFAGVGIREFVFYFGAQFFHFNEDISASVALSFSLITAFVSFMGVVYLIKPIKLEKKN